MLSDVVRTRVNPCPTLSAGSRPRSARRPTRRPLDDGVVACIRGGGFRVPDTKTLGRGDYDENTLKGKTLEQLEDLVRGIEVEGDAARGFTAKAIGKLPTGSKFPKSASAATIQFAMIIFIHFRKRNYLNSTTFCIN